LEIYFSIKRLFHKKGEKVKGSPHKVMTGQFLKKRKFNGRKGRNERKNDEGNDVKKERKK